MSCDDLEQRAVARGVDDLVERVGLVGSWMLRNQAR